MSDHTQPWVIISGYIALMVMVALTYLWVVRRICMNLYKRLEKWQQKWGIHEAMPTIKPVLIASILFGCILGALLMFTYHEIRLSYDEDYQKSELLKIVRNEIT